MASTKNSNGHTKYRSSIPPIIIRLAFGSVLRA